LRGRKPGPKPSGDRSWDPGTGPGNAGTGLGDLGTGPGDFGTGPGDLGTGAGVPETGPGVPQVLVLSLSLSLSRTCSFSLKFLFTRSQEHASFHGVCVCGKSKRPLSLFEENATMRRNICAIQTHED